MRLAAALLIPFLFLVAWDASGQPAPPPNDPDAPEPVPANGEPAPTSEPPDKAGKADEAQAPDAPVPIPLAKDTLRGRFTLSLAGGLMIPFGSLEKEIPWRRASGLGPSAELEPAIGVSRSVMLGLWAHISQPGHGGACESCTTQSVAGGPLIRFHIVQGLKLDPWVSMGVGVRSIAVSAEASSAYVGFEWLRLSLGSDWYASRGTAVGPYVQFVGGSTLTRPDAPPVGDRPFDARGSVYGVFSAGLRLSLAVPSR